MCDIIYLSLLAAISSDTNKLARRASKLDLVHSAGVCFVDLWDHGTGERAFVGRSGPKLCSYKFC